MPTITVQSLVSKARTLLQDLTSIRYPDAELLGWINDGQVEIAAMRPDACTKIGVMQTAIGTLQSVPSDGSMAMKITRNMGASGTTPGRAIRKVDMDLLDGQVPDWHSGTVAAQALHYILDPRIPRNFYLYPPANGSTYIELIYASPPAAVPILTAAAATYTQSGTTVTVSATGHGLNANGFHYFNPSTGTTPAGYYRITSATTGTFTFTAATSASTSGNCLISSVLSVDDVYSVPLIDYMAWRAYSKDDDAVGNQERAGTHRQNFVGYLTGKSQADASAWNAAAADTFGNKA